MKRLMLEVTLENNAPKNPNPEVQTLILMELDEPEATENSYWTLEYKEKSWWWHFKEYIYFGTRETWYNTEKYQMTSCKIILVDL